MSVAPHRRVECSACAGDGFLAICTDTPANEIVTRDSRVCTYCRGKGYDMERIRPYLSNGELVAERRQLDQNISCGLGSSGRASAEARIAEINRELAAREQRDERQAGADQIAQLAREYLDARVEFASRGWSNTQLRGAVHDRWVAMVEKRYEAASAALEQACGWTINDCTARNAERRKARRR